jgi:hypothetical protein
MGVGTYHRQRQERLKETGGVREKPTGRRRLEVEPPERLGLSELVPPDTALCRAPLPGPPLDLSGERCKCNQALSGFW